MISIGLVIGCAEGTHYAWELADAPRALMIRTDVVEDGPLAEDIGSVQVDRRRAEVLPGDVVELDALVATADGRIDLEATEAAWFFCGESCAIHSFSEAPPCEAAPTDDEESCRAGTGRPRVLLPGEIGPIEAADASLWQQVFVVSGRSATETDACVAKLARLSEPLQECAIGGRTLAYGPTWRVLEESLRQTFSEWDEEPQLPDVPLDLARLVPPNSAPELHRLWVRDDETGEEAIHDLETTITVPVGSKLSIRPEVEPSDRQFVIAPVSGVPNGYTAVFDTFLLEILTDDEGDVGVLLTDIAVGFAQPTVRLEVSDRPGIVSMWLLVNDSRQGKSWARARLEVVGE